MTSTELLMWDGLYFTGLGSERDMVSVAHPDSRPSQGWAGALDKPPVLPVVIVWRAIRPSLFLQHTCS